MSDEAPPPDADFPSDADSPGSTQAPNPIPWETPGTPFLEGLLGTLKLFVTQPQEAFRRMPVNSDFLRPLLYLIVIGWVAAWVEYGWQAILGGVMQGLIPGAGEMDAEQMGAFFGTAAFQLLTTLLYPLVAILTTFVGAAILHLFLMLVGGASNGYFATFRVVCYTSGTTALASLVPICGSFAGIIWSLVLSIIGLSVAHRTTQGKAALAVLLPLVLVCLCMFVGSCILGVGLSGLLQQSP